MTGIDIFAWVVFIVIIVATVFVFVALAQLPGKAARERNHPQAEAINLASWLGLLLTMGIVWVVAMVWSRMTPVNQAVADGEADALRARIDKLEAQLAEQGGGSS